MGQLDIRKLLELTSADAQVSQAFSVLNTHMSILRENAQQLLNNFKRVSDFGKSGDYTYELFEQLEHIVYVANQTCNDTDAMLSLVKRINVDVDAYLRAELQANGDIATELNTLRQDVEQLYESYTENESQLKYTHATSTTCCEVADDMLRDNAAIAVSQDCEYIIKICYTSLANIYPMYEALLNMIYATRESVDNIHKVLKDID